MKTKHIFVFGLLVAVTLSGCTQKGSGLREMASTDEVYVTPMQTADLVEAAESGVKSAQNVSFSAGNEIQSPLDTPKCTPIITPPATAKSEPSPDKADIPKPKRTDNQQAKPSATPSEPPKQTTAPNNTPKPTQAPAQTSNPVPTPTPDPIPAPTPKPPTGRTICNTCGADITGNVAAHGDSHLLNNENFSYRVE